MRDLPDYYTDDPPPRPTSDRQRQAYEDERMADGTYELIPVDVVSQLMDAAVKHAEDRKAVEYADAVAIADRAFEQYETDGYHNPDAELDAMLHAWGVTRGLIPVSDADVEAGGT